MPDAIDPRRPRLDLLSAACLKSRDGIPARLLRTIAPLSAAIRSPPGALTHACVLSLLLDDILYHNDQPPRDEHIRASMTKGIIDNEHMAAAARHRSSGSGAARRSGAPSFTQRREDDMV